MIYKWTKGDKGNRGLDGKESIDELNRKNDKDVDISIVNSKVDRVYCEANTKEQDNEAEANTESLIKEAEQLSILTWLFK